MWLLLFSLLFALLLSEQATRAAKFAPNHFLGSCFDQKWVERVQLELGISSTDRDAQGRLLTPHLHAALKTPRFTVRRNSPTSLLPGVIDVGECGYLTMLSCLLCLMTW